MRAADLHPGDVLYYDTSPGWRDRSGCGYRGKATVVVANWHVDRKVYVDVQREGYARVSREWIPPAHLRGHYLATKAAVDAAYEQRRRAESDAADVAVEEAQVRFSLLGRAGKLGLSGIYENGDGFVVDTHALAELIEGYESTVLTRTVLSS